MSKDRLLEEGSSLQQSARIDQKQSISAQTVAACVVGYAFDTAWFAAKWLENNSLPILLPAVTNIYDGVLTAVDKNSSCLQRVGGVVTAGTGAATIALAAYELPQYATLTLAGSFFTKGLTKGNGASAVIGTLQAGAAGCGALGDAVSTEIQKGAECVGMASSAINAAITVVAPCCK